MDRALGPKFLPQIPEVLGFLFDVKCWGGGAATAQDILGQSWGVFWIFVIFLKFLLCHELFSPVWCLYNTPWQLFIPTPTKCYQPRHSKKKNFQFCRQRACEKAKLKIFLFWMSCAGSRKDLWLGFVNSYLSYLTYPYLNWGDLIGRMTYFSIFPPILGDFLRKIIYFFYTFWLILTFWGV